MTKYAIFDNSFFRTKPNWIPGKLYRAICNRSNPRSKEYMEILLHNNFSDYKITEYENLPAGNNQILLLYPDSIGLGWHKIEKNMKNAKVLNGRGRVFDLNKKTKFELSLKRFLEISFLPEIILIPIIIIFAMALNIKDKLTGRL